MYKRQGLGGAGPRHKPNIVDLNETGVPRVKAEKLLQQMRDMTGNQELTYEEAAEGAPWQFGEVRFDPVQGALKFSDTSDSLAPNKRYLRNKAKEYFRGAYEGEGEGVYIQQARRQEEKEIPETAEASAAKDAFLAGLSQAEEEARQKTVGGIWVGPDWDDVVYPEETEYNPKNVEKIDEVLNYLLAHMESIDED